MAYNALPSIDRLYDVFRPHFMRGELTWRPKFKTSTAGKNAGFTSPYSPYVRVKVDRTVYFMHRIMYAMYHGSDPGPNVQIDHVNGNPLDNTATNLRLATPAQNRQNGKRKRNGLKGAYHSTNSNFPWASSIDANGKRYALGLFKTEEEAHAAYVAASAKYHGRFGRLV